MMTIMPITPTSPYITPLSNDDAGEPPPRAPVGSAEPGGEDVAEGKTNLIIIIGTK